MENASAAFVDAVRKVDCDRSIGHSRPPASSAVWVDQRKDHQIHSTSDNSLLSVVPAGNGDRFELRLQYLPLAKVVTICSALNFFFGIFLLLSRSIPSYRLVHKKLVRAYLDLTHWSSGRACRGLTTILPLRQVMTTEPFVAQIL